MPLFSKSYTLGLVFIFLVGIIWAAASVLMQHIYDDLEFRSPFFLTYLTNSLLIIYLPLWQIWLICGAVGTNAKSVASHSTVSELHCNSFQDQSRTDDSYIPVPSYSNAPVSSTVESKKARTEPYTHLDVIRIAAVIAPLYILSNGLYNYSLIMTSVSSSTIISNLSGTFTFAFSWYLGLEGFTYGKIFGIMACFLGAVCVGLNDSQHAEASSSGSDSHHTVMGDSVALCGAVCYGLYTTVLKYMIPDDDGISMQLLLGYVGSINAIFLAPVLMILFYTGTEQLGHLTGAVVGFMVISGLFNNVISDYLWARSVVLTSSTVATVGLSITIPLAMVSDLLIQHRAPTALSSAGALLVIIGFGLVNVSKEHETDLLVYLGGSYYRPVSKEGALIHKLDEIELESI